MGIKRSLFDDFRVTPKSMRH